jgi:type I restriction enzyme, S subunit
VKARWQTKRLGDVATLQRGFDLPIQNRVAGEFPLVSSSGISDTHHKCAVCGPGVVTGRSGSIGNVFFIEDDFWPLNTVLYVKDFHGNDPRFVFHLLKKFDLQRFASGAGVPTLNRNFVHDELVSVPPLSEQKRIVAVLDEAFEAISAAVATAEKNLANARELFESYLNSIFTRKGDGWVEKLLGDVCENLDSKRIPITKSERSSGDVPYYGASGIVDHVADYIFDENLLLVSEDGANLLARTYPIAFSITGKTWVNNHAHVLRFDEIGSQKFIEYYLNSIRLDDYVSGMAQPKLNQKSLNSICVPFPPLPEQIRVVESLEVLSSEIQRLESIYQQKLDGLAELKQSILQKAFAGELPAQPEQCLQEAVA